MAWAPIDQSMRDGVEMIKLRRATGLPAATLLGHITLLWLWALDNALDGKLPAESFVVADAVQWPGDPDELIQALIASGYVLAINADGDEWEIAHFAERMAAYAEKVNEGKARTRERVQRYRDRIRASGESLESYTKYREQVYERDAHRCVYCGKSGTLCLDHLIPVLRGGDGTPENLVAACKRCNSGKAGRLPHECGYSFAQPHAAELYRAALSRLPVTPVTVTGVTHDTPVTPYITVEKKTEDQSTEDERALAADEAPIARARDSANKPTWINEDAKFRAFAEYKLDDADRRFAEKNAPLIDLDAELEAHTERWHVNRRKLGEYDSPRFFFRRWLRKAQTQAEERASKQGRSQNVNTYAERRLQPGGPTVGAVASPRQPAAPEDSRELVRARRVAPQ